MKKCSFSGFSLVEMAVVLAIVALLLGGLLPTLSGQVEKQRRNETQKYMGEVRDALLGFSVANGRLPCPDTDATPDGSENSPCQTDPEDQFGTLPYKNLGVTSVDGYGGVLIYGVSKDFALNVAPPPFFTLTSTKVMDVCATAACVSADKLANDVVAVIVSRGANWANPSAYSTDESENTDSSISGDTNFVSHDLVQNGYDDLVVWLSPNTLFNRMVAAGKLP